MLNEYYRNISIKGYIDRYGIWNGFKRAAFTANPIHIVRDYEVKKLLWQKKAASRIDRYMKYEDVPPEGLFFPKVEVDDPIWVFWDSGFDNAPEIVKICCDSIKKYGGRQTIFLSSENLSNYLKMPEYIEVKQKNGQIPMAGFTDLMRFALLDHYGGTWIDSTVYLTKEIPEEILNADFFAFRNSLGLLDNPVLYPAWFLRARKGNEIIDKARNIAFAYWTSEKHVIEYLLPNLIITRVIGRNINTEDSMPYLNSDYSEYLIKVLADEFSEEKWKWIKSLTGIHKLTYKLDERINKKNSFYRFLINSGAERQKEITRK